MVSTEYSEIGHVVADKSHVVFLPSKVAFDIFWDMVYVLFGGMCLACYLQ